MSTPVIEQPGGEVMLGKPVIAQPAYPEQQAPPAVLFGRTPITNSAYYYSHPEGFQPSPLTLATAMPIGAAPRPGVPMAYAAPAPQSMGGPTLHRHLSGDRDVPYEVVANFTNADLTNTAHARYAGDGRAVTHANFFWNDIARIDGLERFPNLIRLTLRGNHLVTLHGISACPHLRWLDISTNDLRDFSGASLVQSLEWLDAQNNYLRTLDGLGFAPNLTWLSVRNSDLISLRGLQLMPNLRALDASKNELGTTSGIEGCPLLLELNLAVNNLTDLAGVPALRELRALDVSSNELDNVPMALRQCTQLQTLRVAHNNLASHNVRALLETFGGHQSLSKLAIGRNSFTPADVHSLRTALSPIGCEIDASDREPADEAGSGGSRAGNAECGASCVIA
jgi:hypothetical protein